MSTTKSVREIEEKMENLEESSLRYQILQTAKNFKTSWIELGRALYSVWKDKQYKEWGYLKFDTYVTKEVGIRKQTAVKLLKSYYFLEKEEPDYLKADYAQASDAAKLPGYESIDLLRLAKNKKTLNEDEYNNLKKDIFEKGKDPHQIRKDLTAMIKQREELDPEEARQKRKIAKIRRFLGILKSLKEEIELSKLVSSPVIKEAANLIKKLEAELA